MGAMQVSAGEKKVTGRKVYVQTPERKAPCKRQQDALDNSAADAVPAIWVFPKELVTL